MTAAHRARGCAGARVPALDPVRLEIFNNLFMSIAEQMGVRLQSTAHSVNIKERLDFSCAIFDAAGNLIANARTSRPPRLDGRKHQDGGGAQRGRIRRGDVYTLNDPYHGGTHLPDITVVTPVFHERRQRTPVLRRVAWPPRGGRRHHPGSMPAFSTRIEEEGVLIDNWLLAAGGVLRESDTIVLLRSAPFPSRNPGTNIADLRAQIAANEKGAREAPPDGRALRAGRGGGLHGSRAGQRRGGGAPRHPGAARRRVRLRTRQRRRDQRGCPRRPRARTAAIDFTGTSPQLTDNFNAPSSVAMAAVLYVLRTLVADEIPLDPAASSRSG